MKRCFIPYAGEDPLVVEVNGHELVFVSFDENAFDEDHLPESQELEDDVEVRSVEFEDLGIDETAVESSEGQDSDLEQMKKITFLDKELNIQEVDELPDIAGGDDGVPDMDLQNIIDLQITPEGISPELMTAVAQKLAARTQCGVLFVPSQVPLNILLETLSEELPWLQ